MYNETNPENLNPEEELEYECSFCGEPVAKEYDFCNRNCKKAYYCDM